MAHPAHALLKRRGVQTRIITVLVGLMTGGMGAFMIVMHVFRLDPTMRHMSLPMVIALWVVALGFLGIGALLVGVALFKSGGQQAQLLHDLEHHPERIACAQEVVASRRGVRPGSGGIGTQSSLQVEYRDGRVVQIMLRKSDLETVLSYVWSRAPHSRPS